MFEPKGLKPIDGLLRSILGRRLNFRELLRGWLTLER